MVTPLLSDLLPLPLFSSGCRLVHRCQSPLQHRSIEENSAAKSATPSGSESERKLLLIWLQNYPQYGPYMRELLIRGLRFRAMELDPDLESQIQEDSAISTPIDPRRACFPRCIVWSPLPVISWFIPFIGHVGICREDGVILDFAGPNFVCVDNFAFGSATQYIQINKEKCLVATHSTSFHEDEDQSHEFGRDMSTWDDALRKGTQEFQHLSYNLFTCNCHSFVANNLNRLGFRSGGWNVVNLAILFLLKGRWVSKGAMVRTLLPFAVVFVLGLLLGGSTFLTFWAFFTFLLVGWFIFGTYCLKDVIQL